MSVVLDTARRAFDTIPFYRRLYGSRPERDADVPFLSVSAFHRAATPLDIVASTESIRGIVPAFSRHARRLPVAVLESEAEWKLRLDRFRHALSVLDAAPEEGRRFAIIADESTGPFAADIANFLAWDRAECSVIFHLSDGPVEVDRTLASLAPDIILYFTGTSPMMPMQNTTARLVTSHHIDNPSNGLFTTDRLLVSDELFVIGAARPCSPSYVFDPRSVLIEEDPESGRMAVTTTAFDCLALVRSSFDLPHAGAVAHAGI
jgi:hypothetical protein